MIECSPSGQNKSAVKRKLYDDVAPAVSSDGPKNRTKKATASVATVQHAPALSVPAAQVVMAPKLQGPTVDQSGVKKQKTAGE